MRLRDFVLAGAIALALIIFAAVAHLLLVPVLTDVGSMSSWVLGGWLLQPIVLARVIMEEAARISAVALIRRPVRNQLFVAGLAGLIIGVAERVPGILSLPASYNFDMLAVLGILSPIVLHVANSLAAVAVVRNLRPRPLAAGLLVVGMVLAHLFQNQFLLQVAGRLPIAALLTAALTLAVYAAWGWFSLRSATTVGPASGAKVAA